MHSIANAVAAFDQDFLLLDKGSRYELSLALLRYAFRNLEATQLSDKFKHHLEWSGQDCINFRKVMARTGYIQKHLKFHVYAYVVGSEHRDPLITKEDHAFTRLVTRSTDKDTVQFIKHCKRYKRQGFPPRTLDSFDKALNIAVRDLEISVRKFVHAKFRFLTQSSQSQVDEEVQELLAVGLYAMYRAYPVIQNVLHLTNIGRTASHNAGINKLKSETTQSRGRVMANSDGTFRGTVLSLNFNPAAGDAAGLFMNEDSVQVGNSLMVGLDGKSIDGERLSDVDRQRDLQNAVLHIEQKLKYRPRSLKFLHLLMGNFDEDFTAWLGHPNDELSDKMDRREYAEKVRQFMDIPVPSAQKFVRKLRANLQLFVSN